MQTRTRRFLWLSSAVLALVVAGWAGWRWLEAWPLRAAADAYRRSDWPAAYGLSEAYRRRHPTSRKATLVVMRSLAQLGRCQEALNLSRRVSDIAPDDLHLIASCLASAGVRSGSRSALGSAAELYRQILQDKPDDADALKRLAALLVQLNRPAEAMESAAKLAASPAHARAGHAILGAIYHSRADHERAVEHLLQVLELDPELKQGPESPQSILLMAAQDLLQLGRGTEAEMYLLRLPAAQHDPEILWQLGQARRLQSDVSQALEYWKAATRLEPDYVPALRDIGALELGRGRFDAALESLERVASLAPQDVTVRYQLAEVLTRIGREEEAAQYLRDAQRLKETR